MLSVDLQTRMGKLMTSNRLFRFIIARLIPQAKLVVLKDQGHDALITKWKSVNEEIESFLMV